MKEDHERRERKPANPSACRCELGKNAGCSIGPIIALVSVVLSDLFGTKDLAMYHGCSRTGVGLGNLLGIPLLSLLAEKQGFTVALILSGALVSFSTVFLIILEFLHRRKQRAEVQESRC
ncbi:unnamed protein product [Cladocopium goreaui]|uniref:Monocarboxylate transporter 2 n=1 Tax=Cladocopium goreaui TaxID=2562237 RepID=A0A9P1DN98_9DINO|nr:unnamed protein product [Cladocopium goreaui]